MKLITISAMYLQAHGHAPLIFLDKSHKYTVGASHAGLNVITTVNSRGAAVRSMPVQCCGLRWGSMER